jgi:hypothetical protein
MSDTIFLSAGVPDPARGPQYAATADTVAITAAVSALVHVTLGRRILVWGGHPAITPMVWAVAEALGVDYGAWVKLYQSEFFRDEFPEDNERFRNVTYTPKVDGDLGQSLHGMREKMFTDYSFKSAVFIGGMGGIVTEFEMLRRLQPSIDVKPVVSTGGAVLDVAQRMTEVSPDLADDLDYVNLFHRHLGIPVGELRYRDPSEQPAEAAQRLWRRSGN